MADSLNGQLCPSTAHSTATQPHHISMDHAGESFQAGHSDADTSYVPRPKRIACVVCRRRKLRCDGKKPSCGTCTRLGHECAYDEVRKKSGPKRGYVKQLEARLAQVETLLKTQEVNTTVNQGNDFNITAPITGMAEASHTFGMESLSPPEVDLNNMQSSQAFMTPGVDRTGNFGWDMISLGLEEPLPSRDVIDELNQIYFEKIHPYIPILHRPRHLAAMNLPPNIRPPICLQYITWSQAASVSEKYSNLHALFYQRARKYAELDEMKGLGESILSLPYCQTWLLVGSYEFRMMFFPRAWLSVGKAARLAVMLGLNRLDGLGLEVKQSLPPARDWTEKEERRRVFWMAFCVDRFASVGTGWPVAIDERDVKTNLPASEEAFNKSKPQQTLRIDDIRAGNGYSTLSPFAGVSFMAYMLGRNLSHLHRPDPNDNDHDLNGLYWQRHRSHDNILLHFTLAMPNHLRLPPGIFDPNVIFCNMAIHTSTICLHQAAIFKAEKNRMPEQLITESKRRCIVAADQISNIMKMISHMDLTCMNPFMSYSVYIAARVFVQYLKSRPDDTAARSSLQFVFSALDALKANNPLTESFLVQLDVDIEGTPFQNIRPTKKTTKTPEEDKEKGSCTPLLVMSQRKKQRLTNDPPPTTTTTTTFTPSSLPSRSKQSPQQQQQQQLDASSSDPFTKSPYGLNSSTDTDSPVSNDTSMLTDPSAYLSLNATNKQPSPLNQQQQQQQQSSNFENTALNMMGNINTPFGAFDLGLSSQLFQTGMPTPLDSNGSEGSLPIPPTWEFDAPPTQIPENVDLTSVGIDSFNEAQWAQLLRNAGVSWDAWRNQS
ncbi:fungal-specific transcription factor domain-containing protein [Aspergillus avenaceus]|uniref:Fungal-specific transcription factor domain-containing protein n=1 Tax=Aspergillus avenaceus TaxID=36643 RepID=A0A5N6TZP4_ASPAV|nr:fungal-specific transcription factor domain-containing protein [Aspergillus avenaceus]